MGRAWVLPRPSRARLGLSGLIDTPTINNLVKKQMKSSTPMHASNSWIHDPNHSILLDFENHAKNTFITKPSDFVHLQWFDKHSNVFFINYHLHIYPFAYVNLSFTYYVKGNQPLKVPIPCKISFNLIIELVWLILERLSKWSALIV